MRRWLRPAEEITYQSGFAPCAGSAHDVRPKSRLELENIVFAPIPAYEQVEGAEPLRKNGRGLRRGRVTASHPAAKPYFMIPLLPWNVGESIWKLAALEKVAEFDEESIVAGFSS